MDFEKWNDRLINGDKEQTLPLMVLGITNNKIYDIFRF